MADSVVIKTPELDIGKIVNESALAEIKDLDNLLKSIVRTLSSTARGKNLAKFWKPQEDIIEDIIASYERYNKVSSVDNLSNLANSVNSLKALRGNDLSDILPNFREIESTIRNVRLDSVFDVSSFKEFFDVYTSIERLGGDVQNIFRYFDIDTESLDIANEEILRLQRKVETLKEKLADAEDSSGLAVLRQELEKANKALENIRSNESRTFKNFLNDHNIPLEGEDFEGNYDDNLYRDYFNKIESGALTASEAITNFKREYSYLLETETTFDTSQLTDFANKLDTIGREITEIKQNGVPTIGSAVGSESTDMGGLNKVIDSIKDLNDADDVEGLTNVYASLGQLLTTIKEIGQIDIVSLENLYYIIKSLGGLNDIKINKTSLDNLAECLERISRISNTSPLIGLSNIDFSKFNDLHISKASLNNLAEYLPSISNINVDQLIKLTSLDFSNLNNIKIEKSALNSLKEFIASLKDTLGDNVAGTTAAPTTPNADTSEMEKVTKAKKEFAEANRNVQNSAEISASPLQTEADLMNQIAVSAKDAAKAKKQFANANKEVKEKADSSSSGLKEEKKAMDDVTDTKKDKTKRKDSSKKDSQEVAISFVPRTEGFDEIVSKFPLLQEDKDEIVEIVESSVQNKDGKYDVSYRAKYKDGRSYVLGENSEPQVLNATRHIEGSSLKQREALSKESYDREIQCLEEINKLKISNLTADLDGRGKNNENIQALEEEIELIRELREEKQITATADGDKRVSDKQAELDIEFENAKKKESDADSNFKDAISELRKELKKAFDSNENASNETRIEAENLINQLGQPNFGEYNGIKFARVNSGNVDSVIDKLKKDTEKIINALKEEEEKLSKTGESSNYSNRLEESLKNIKIGNANFSKVLKTDAASGSATLEFIEQIGDKARVTTVKILDMDKALDSIENNSFNIKDGNYTESTGSWKTVKTENKSKKKGLKETIAEKTGVTEALERQIQIAKELANIEKEKAKYAKDSRRYIDLTTKESKLTEENEGLNETLSKYPLLYDAEKHATDLSKARSDIEKDTAKSISSQVDSLTSKVNKYTNREKYTENITSMASTLLNDLAKEDISSEDIAKIHESLSVLKNDSGKLDNIKLKDTSKLDKFITKLTEYREKYTAMSDSEKAEMDALINKAKELADSSDVSIGAFEELESSFTKLDRKIIESGNKISGFFSIIKNRMTDANNKFIAQFFSLQDWIRYIRQAAEMVIEVNTSVTELAKVSEQSSAQIYKDLNSYTEIAKEMGATISNTISATADWSKNGYSIPEAKQLAEVSLLYKNIGDGIDIDTANESLISTLQGFELAASDAEHIIDVFNEVSNNNAISSAGIGEALQRSAAAFNASNTSLEKSVALITATNEVVQDPSKVGNMWKTVSARIRGANAELTDMGEDTEGMVESTSELRDLVKSMTGFDIMEDNNTFKDMYEIIVGIGKEWKNLDDISQASLLEKLAGKNHSNALAAALNNVDTLEKSYGEATNSEGSARKEQSKYEESVQYSIDRIKTSLQELANDALSSGLIKTFVDGANAFLNVLDFIIDDFGLLKSSAIAISGILGKKGHGLTNYIVT